MKWCIVLIVAVTVLAVLETVEARRPKKNKPQKCKYVKPKHGSPWTDCVDGFKNKTLALKPRQNDSCEATKDISKPCKADKPRGNCDYDVSRSECLEGKKTITKMLVDRSDAECDPTITFEKDCQAGETASKIRCSYNINVNKNGCVDGGSGMVVISKTPVEVTEDCDTTITKEKKCRNKDCIYSKRGATCNRDTRTMEKTLKKALNGAQCESTETVPCRPRKMKKLNRKMKKKGAGKCKYKRGRWMPCDLDTNTVTRTFTLRRGHPSECKAVVVETRACRKQGKVNRLSKLKRRTKKKKRRRRKKKNGAGCGYTRQPWSPCNAATNTVSRTLTLKKGDPAVCNATKTETVKCKDKHLRQQACKYRRTAWGDCDPITNMKTMIKTLKSGDQATCASTETISRKCKRKQNPGQVCKYSFDDWGECNNTTNTMTRRQTLKSGNPANCPPFKNNTRKCKIPCKFKNGRWSACDPVTKIMERVDTIQKGSEPFCEQTRVITKKCGVERRKKCKYDFGTWEDCNVDTNKRTRIRSLVSGDDDCEQEKVETRSCSRPNGKVRCFFGRWEKYGPCQNGVQKKERVVLQGGLDCQRKGVKMKSCS